MNHVVLTIIFFLLFFHSSHSKALPNSGQALEFDSMVSFVESDYARGRLFISLPDENRVAVVSTETLTEITSIAFDGQPHGLDISADRSTLYVALSGVGKVAIVDIEDGFSITEIDVTSALTEANASTPVTSTYDVMALGSDRLYFSADTGSGRATYVGYIDLNNNRIIRAGINLANTNFYTLRDKPRFEASLDESTVFVYTGTGNLVSMDVTVEPNTIRAENSDRDSSFGFFSIPNEGYLFKDGRLISDKESLFSSRGILENSRDRIRNTDLSEDQKYVIGTTSSTWPFRVASVALGDPDVLSYEAEVGCSGASSVSQTVAADDDQGLFLVASEPDGSSKICYFYQDNDADGRFDLVDNCTGTHNQSQLNRDGDRFGDACDLDIDGDGLSNENDPFPNLADGDEDGVDDWLDSFPEFGGASRDTDLDGKPDFFYENCDLACQTESGLEEDNDDDDDGQIDSLDPAPLINFDAIYPEPTTQLTRELNGASFIEYDFIRGRAYVSLPSERAIAFVNLSTFETEYRLTFDGRPQGLDLDDSFTKLYVGLEGTGELAIVDLTSPSLEKQLIPVYQSFRRPEPNEAERSFHQTSDIFDVIRVQDKVYLNSSFDSSRIVSVNLLDIDQPPRIIADGFGFAARTARFAKDQSNEILYLHSVLGLFRFDATQDGTPLIDRTDNSVGFEFRLRPPGPGFEVAPNGERIVIGNGQVADGSDLSLIANRYDFGVADLDGNNGVYVGMDNSRGVLSEYDFGGLYTLGSVSNPCFDEFGEGDDVDARDIHYSQNGLGWFLYLQVRRQSGGDTSQHFCFFPRPQDFDRDSPPKGGSISISDHFPLQPNVQRLFTSTSDPEPESVAVASRNQVQINGVLTTPLNFTNPNLEAFLETEYYSTEEDGVFLVRNETGNGFVVTNSLDFTPAIPMIPRFLAVGSAREQASQIKIEDFGQESSLLGDVRVEVTGYDLIDLPGGSQVWAYKVNQSITVFTSSNRATIEQNYWLAEGLGIVRSSVGEGEDEVAVTLIAPKDLDGDGIHDILDGDIDGDGVDNLTDKFPLNPSETSDNDNDGIGDNRDRDDDNDLIPDVYEIANQLNHLDPNDASRDFDGDGRSNLTEYRDGTDPNLADQAVGIVDESDSGLIIPMLQLLLLESR